MIRPHERGGVTLKVCSLASGSSGNATYLATERASLLVDCGTSAREVVARLGEIGIDPRDLDAILISHAHVDHYRSAGTIHARFGVPVYVDPSTARALERRGWRTSWKRVRDACPIPDRIGDLEIEAHDTSHGFGDGEGRTVAFTFRGGRSRAGVVTDLGTVSPSIARALKGCDAVILEANFDEELVRRKLGDPWYASDWHRLRWLLSDRGHLSNRQCAEALAGFLTSRDTHVFLGHLSDNHDDPRSDNNSREEAMRTVREVLRREGLPVPILHATHRIGKRTAGPSDLVVI
jgi:phosphoribosyl 1,2-cyclic phosphodiesterase